MNAPRPPLSPDQVDELLSAELDGEFDAAAADLGFTSDDARARLVATPGVDTRRASLTSARDALAKVPELDELMAARLRAKAVKAGTEERASVAHARQRRRYRALSAVAGIAAALVIVVGIGLALNNNSSNEKQSRASAAGGAQTAPSTEVPSAKAAGTNFGDAPDANALAQSVAAKLSGRESDAVATGGHTESTPRSLNYQSSSDASSAYATSCDAAARGFSGVNTAPDKIGSAQIAGSPVLVYAFPKGVAHVIVIVTPDCKLVIQQVAPTPAP